MRQTQEKAALVKDANEWSEGRLKVPGCAPGVGSNRPMPKVARSDTQPLQ